MKTFRSSEVFYLNEFRQNEDLLDLSIKSANGYNISINKLFLVSLSPLLKQNFTDLEPNVDENFTIITDYDQNEIEFLVNFCTHGILPKPMLDLVKDEKILNVFHSFGIDLKRILFKTEKNKEIFCQNDFYTVEDNGEDQEKTKSEVKTEPEITDENWTGNRLGDFFHEKNSVKPKELEISPIEDDDDAIIDDFLQESSESSSDDENKPLLSLKKRKKSFSNSKQLQPVNKFKFQKFDNDADNQDETTTQPSQLMSKHKNYTQIQVKYKNYLSVTIPTLEKNTDLKFNNYIPLQPLEFYWKPPRPPSRKKKQPKDYEKYPLECQHCSKRFTSEILQAFHLKVYHSPHFQCPYCPNAYHQHESQKFKKHLYNHEHVTKTDRPHSCIQCGKEDFCLQRLQKHIDNFRGPFHNNQCTQCSEKFQNHQDYREHVDNFHQGRWKFRCDDCEVVFDSIQNAREHRLEVHKRKQPPKHTIPTMCDICGKVLKGSSIPNHMKIVHMSELPDTPCPHCGKIVKELSRHIKRSHEKLTCDLCGKLVPPGHMLRHNDQYHTAPEERRYKCEICSKGFSTKQRLTDHVHTHTGEKPYTCQYCGKGFANSSGCRLHVRFTHLGQKRLRKKET